MDYSDGLWKTVLKLVITNKWFIIILVTFASILLTLHKVFKDDLNKKYERLCIYDLHLFLMSFNLRFLYILIFFLGGGVLGVFIQQQNNFITMHLPTFILKEHSSFSDLICLPMTYDVTGIIKNKRLQIFDPYVLSLLWKKESID